jgi:putative ABC transport system ATP-binding protein
LTAIIEMNGVRKTYRRGGETLVVLDGLDLTLDKGDFVALMGPSGSGKSTILNLVGGLDTAEAGTITVAGETITSMSPRKLPGWRARHIGFVFQSFNLVPVLTALENVMLPLLLTPLSSAERRKQAEFALEVVGLSDRAGHRPRQLSGGQEQRVAIARAIATDPDIVLADEPTGDLDRESATAVMDLLLRLNSELGKTFVIVTHDPVVGDRASATMHLDKGLLTDVVQGAGA